MYIISVILFCTYSCQNHAAKGKEIVFSQLRKCTPIVLVKNLDGSVNVLDKTKRETAVQTLSTHFFSDLFPPVTLQLRRMAPTAILVLLQPSQTPVDMRG